MLRATTLDETGNAERDDLIEKAAAFAASRKGTGGPPGDTSADLLRYFYRHVAAEDLAIAHRDGPVRRRDEPVQGRVVPAPGHREHPGLHPDRRRARLVGRRAHGRRGGHRRHAVPRRLRDHGAQRAEPRGAHGRAPADPGPPRHHRPAPGDPHRRRPAGRPGRAAARRLPRVVDAHRDRPRVEPRRSARRSSSALAKVLQDVREAVEDWPKMHQQALDIIDDLEAEPAAAAGRGDRRGPGAAALAGRHPLHVPRLPRVPPRGGRATTTPTTSRCAPCPAPASASCAPTRTCPRRSRKLPPLVRAKAREKTLLVLAKANSKATVHRPVYLDYVGVKTFDENGEVVGERRFLGLFSSAAYTESLTRIPVIRVKAKQVIDRAGFAPLSHTGKALMDVLETYPRDELFQTPIDELVPIARVGAAHPRAPPGAAVRAPRHLRPLPVLPGLPAARPLQRPRCASGSPASSRRSSAATSLEYTARVSESLLARLHFVIRPEPGETDRRLRPVPTSSAGSPRRRGPGATTSWPRRTRSTARRTAPCWPASTPTRSPRPTRRTTRRGPARSTSAGSRGSRPTSGLDLSFYQPPDGRPGEARLKIFRIGSPLSLSEVLPILSSMGVEVVDERPYELDGLERESYIYDFGLRYHRPLPDAAPASCSRTPSPRCGRATTRSTASTRWSSPSA